VDFIAENLVSCKCIIAGGLSLFCINLCRPGIVVFSEPTFQVIIVVCVCV